MKQWAERFWRAILDSDYWWLEEEAMWGFGSGASLWEFYPWVDAHASAKELVPTEPLPRTYLAPNGMADTIDGLISAGGISARKAS